MLYTIAKHCVLITAIPQNIESDIMTLYLHLENKHERFVKLWLLTSAVI